MAVPVVGRPPLPPTSTKSILRKSLSIFLSSLPVLLLVSLLLLCLRSALLAGTLRLSSLPDTDPLLRSLLSSLSATSSSTPSSSPRFLRQSSAIPISDDFFSSPPSLARRSLPNSSFPSPIPLFLSHNSIPVDRARVLPADPTSRILFSLPDTENGNRAAKGFSFANNGFELVYILSILSSAHAIALLGFILCYAIALGVVFHCVARSLLSRPMISLTHDLRSGARIGVRHLAGFVFLKWAIRDAMVQFICIWFFANVDDQSKLFKLFIKVKLIPFSLTVMSANDDPQLHGLLFIWGLMDFVMSIFLALVPWVVVVDGNVRRRGQEVFREGVFLVTLQPGQSIRIMCLGMAVGGRLGWLLLSALGGRWFAMWALAVVEVYFMVVWLVLYLEARSKDSEFGGRRFGREDLGRCFDRL
ncbi:hypothetical protein KSP40_PGU015569 [Platanthera guangdongensis]|uniref:Transmembrane protein n=1 Tax=Platanthera guangdongensis TaxID=2320717 RepID=A0ABR2M278_9ASPA